jgi:hypothetical protein
MKRIVLSSICIFILFNISCRKKIEVSNNENLVEKSTSIETQIQEIAEWDKSLEEKYINIINEEDETVEEEVITQGEIRYFRSREKSPLDILIGRWYLVDYNLANKEYNSYFDIYYSGSEYRFNKNYYSSLGEGYLTYEPEFGRIILHIDDSEFFYTIVGEPFEHNGHLIILIDDEGPLGYFQKE